MDASKIIRFWGLSVGPCVCVCLVMLSAVCVCVLCVWWSLWYTLLTGCQGPSPTLSVLIPLLTLCLFLLFPFTDVILSHHPHGHLLKGHLLSPWWQTGTQATTTWSNFLHTCAPIHTHYATCKHRNTHVNTCSNSTHCYRWQWHHIGRQKCIQRNRCVYQHAAAPLQAHELHIQDILFLNKVTHLRPCFRSNVLHLTHSLTHSLTTYTFSKHHYKSCRQPWKWK